MTSRVSLLPLEEHDREQFILDNQEAFLYGATREFGLRDDHLEEDGQIISRGTIEESIDAEGAAAYRIMLEKEVVGGVVLRLDPAAQQGDLELLFVSPEKHSAGIGFQAWCAVEKMYPEIRIWETVTPYFEKRNIHFYVNRCGFHIVEFYNSYHPDLNDPDGIDDSAMDGMFRFEKRMK